MVNVGAPAHTAGHCYPVTDEIDAAYLPFATIAELVAEIERLIDPDSLPEDDRLLLVVRALKARIDNSP